MPDSHLFSPLALRSLTLRNRIGISPMCQYSSVDGHANDWHLMHLGARAAGGAGLVMMEATAVEARGRITSGDMGIWSDDHIKALSPVAAFIKQMGAVAAIQLAHAGRKASCDLPWKGGKPLTTEQGAAAWQTIGASAIPFDTTWHTPAEATVADIATIVAAFKSAAKRAYAAGFQVAEVHGAHGYLLHTFYSPLSNKRTDGYGGSFEGRTRLIREVTAAVRSVWPENLPVLVRISATDWVDGGWTIEDSVYLARQLKAAGADLIDCSSAGNTPKANVPVGPGYQVALAAAVKSQADVPTAAVGMITDARQADDIVLSGKADLVLIARESIRNPNFPIDAARILGVPPPLQNQYARAY